MFFQSDADVVRRIQFRLLHVINFFWPIPTCLFYDYFQHDWHPGQSLMASLHALTRCHTPRIIQPQFCFHMDIDLENLQNCLQSNLDLSTHSTTQACVDADRQ